MWLPARRLLARLCSGLGPEEEGAGWGQKIFVEPRHGKHELPPGDATDDTAMLLPATRHQASAQLLAHILQSRLPLVERDSNLEITETLASALPAHQLQMPAFVGWRRLAAPDRFGASTKPLLLVVR